MAEYQLYGFAQSGNAYKVALCLELAGADWGVRFVDFFNGETRTPAYRENVNVMGEVPVLEHKGQRMSQSGVILDYLSEQFGKFGWRDNPERRDILRWLLWDNHKLSSYSATYRFLRVLAPNPNKDVMEEFGKRAASCWKILDAHLAGKTHVVGDRMTIADISMCGYLFFDDELGVDWNQYPNVRDWLGRIRSETGWKQAYEILPGHPLPKRA